MSMLNRIRRLVTVVGVLALLLLTLSGTAWASNTLEILQAVKNSVPNSGNDRVVMGEVFARDG